MKQKTTLVNEFKTFIARGNVIDLAVGIIVGAAFTGVVNSLVKDIIMPPIGLIIGKVDFSSLRLVLQESNGWLGIPEISISYGLFLQQLLNFFIVAAVVFFLVKAVNALKRKEEKAETPKKKMDTELEVLKRIEKALSKSKK